MQKIIVAALAMTMLTPIAAQAQRYGEVRQDQREVRQDRRDVRDAQMNGNRGDVRDARRELREDRQETREDWRDYRRTHGNVYRRPAYVGPRGYSYRPVSIGYRFAPAYYGRDYWINDYSAYRLGRPGYNERWVRYGRDVIRINIGTGRVVETHNGFFY